jgi:aminoglycoside phosphotransferase (APT) family kinase protein
MQAGLEQFLRRVYEDAHEVVIEGFAPLPGGYSRETFMCDATVHTAGGTHRLPLILRKDPPAVQAILDTSRTVEHHLIEAIRLNTTIPVTRSLGCETDPAVFGEAAMVLERASGSSTTSALFNGGVDEHQVDEVIGHLCEILAELHTTAIDTIDPDGALCDPRGVGIDTTSWESYIDSTCEYYVGSYDGIDFDPSSMIVLDMFLTLRRTKPRPLHLAVIHGDFNPANFLYADGKVTALIDWENARIGDPREDLGWMTTMDVLSATSVMDHPRDKGGFLAYYNTLTGWDVTQEEVDWFTLFGTANIAVPVNAAIKRRVTGEHHVFSQLYMVQASAATLPNLVRLMNYPGVDL